MSLSSHNGAEEARNQGYKTRQRALIEQTLEENGDRHITAEELSERLAQKGFAVGRTTVYRTLERLAEEGKVQKYTAIGESACYQYIESNECCEHFHLKCVSCGKLIHIECNHLAALSEHIAAEHGFQVDMLKTVLYGLCGDCAVTGK